VNSENRKFLFKIKIKDADGKVKELSKTINLKIDWEKFRGKDGGEKVVLQANGKEYPIQIKIHAIKKGLFRDKLISFGIDLLGNFSIWNDRKPGEVIKQNMGSRWMKDEQWNGYHMKPVQWRLTGFVIIGVIIFIIISLLIFIKVKKKKS